MPLSQLYHKNSNKKKFYYNNFLPKLPFWGGTSTLKISKNFCKFSKNPKNPYFLKFFKIIKKKKNFY